MIQESHPLQQLFVELVGRHYAEEIGIRDPQIVNYVAHLLGEFCEAEQLFKIRNAAEQPLTDVGEMLVESKPKPSWHLARRKSRAPKNRSGGKNNWRCEKCSRV